MFKEKTVIILGAGASCHYGYPSGEGLIDKLIVSSKNICDYADMHFKSDRFSRQVPFQLEIPFLQPTDEEFESYRKLQNNHVDWELYKKHVTYTNFTEKLKNLFTNLKSFDPVMIDSFLNDNKSLANIGKLMIAYEILKCENTEKLLRETIKETDKDKEKNNWYKYLVDSIVSGCVESADILQNDLHIITFNYDVSLEHYLYTRLTRIERFTKEDVMQFLNNPEKPLITHAYGKVRENAFEDNEYGKIFSEKAQMDSDQYGNSRSGGKLYKHSIELAYEASKDLKVIDKEKFNEHKDSDHIINARDELKKANKIFILGFGFYEDNIELLGFSNNLIYNDTIHSSPRTIYYTNLNDSQRIERKFTASIDNLDSRLRSGKMSIIKSERKVYDALTYDFDFT